MNRRFEHLGEMWEATGDGFGHGVATGYIPKASRWSVTFRSLTRPDREPLRGHISKTDPNDVEEAQLKRELERQLVLTSIDASDYTWRTVEGLSSELGIPEEVVHSLLEGMADRVIRSIRPDKKGRALYTTRKKYKGDTNFLIRYLDVLNSSST